MLSQKKTNCSQFAHPTWKCHHADLWIAKLFHLTEGLLRSFKRWRLWREPVVGCRRWLWKERAVERAVMCGSWTVRQAVSQQVFRETTYCVNTCLQLGEQGRKEKRRGGNFLFLLVPLQNFSSTTNYLYNKPRWQCTREKKTVYALCNHLISS